MKKDPSRSIDRWVQIPARQKQKAFLISLKSKIMRQYNELELREMFLEAIIQASHSERLERVQAGFRCAVFSKSYEFVYTFRAYEYWLSQDYERAQIASKHAYDVGGSELCSSLCLAHTLRKQAQMREDPAQRSRMIDEARKEYESIASSTDPRLRVVALHSLGNLAGLTFWSMYAEFMKQNQAKEQSKILTETQKKELLKFLVKVMDYDMAAIELERKNNLKYAPPYNRLGDWRLVMVTEGLLPENECLGKLLEAKKYFNKAINQGGNRYAPPILLNPRAIYQIEKRRGNPWVQKVIKLLRTAVSLAPNDPPIYGDISAVLESDDASSIPFADKLPLALGMPAYVKEDTIQQYFLTPRLPEEGPWRDFLLVLKRWSSYTPTITTPGRYTFGGGYLIDWNGYRIAVDPGFDYLRSLSEYGFNIIDLNCVTITHDHPDHIADLDRILCLVYERVEYLKNLSVDKRNENYIACEQTEKLKQMLLLLSPSVRKRLPSTVRKYWKEKGGIKELIPLQPIELHGGKIRLLPLKSVGHKDLGSRPALGLKFEFRDESDLPSRRLGITGDTRYHSMLCADYADCEALVIHVSTVSDLQRSTSRKALTMPSLRPSFVKDFPSFRGFYKKHLGFWGTAKLIADLYEKDPKRERLILLSEIGEELSYHRSDLVKNLTETSARIAGNPTDWSERIKIRVTDIGTRVSLLDPLEVRCQFGGILCPLPGEPIENIPGIRDTRFPHLPMKDVEIQYLCPRHAKFTEKLWRY